MARGDSGITPAYPDNEVLSADRVGRLKYVYGGPGIATTSARSLPRKWSRSCLLVDAMLGTYALLSKARAWSTVRGPYQ